MPPAKPTNLQLTVVGTGQIKVTWTDNASGENGYRVRWAGGGDPRYRSSPDLDPDTTEYTITGLRPNRTYVVRVDAFDSTGISSVGNEIGSVAVPFAIGGQQTTARRTNPVPATGWYVEVVLDDGTVHRPTIIADDAQQNPKVNDRPELRLPVPQADKWRREAFERATVRAWHDGTRQPVDRLEDVETDTAPTRKRNVLVCRGGHELLEQGQWEWQIEEAHVAANEVIDGTSYAANVDAPDQEITQDVQLATATTTTELSNKLTTSTSDRPLTVASDEVTTQQAAFTTEGENADRSSGGATSSANSDYSGGDSLSVSGDSASGGSHFGEWDFTLNYPIEASDFGVQVRDGDNGDADGAPNFKWELQHANGSTYFLDEQNASTVGTPLVLGWSNVGNGTYGGGSGYSGPDLTAGDYTLRVEVTDSNGVLDQFTYAIDVVCPYDTSEGPFTFDDSVHEANGYLDGPELYPASVRAAFGEEQTLESVTVGRVESTWDDTSNEQALRLSNDQGANFQTESNAATFEHDFADLGPSLIFEADVGRYGQRDTATPRTGYKPQSLQDYTLFADTDATPLVIDLSTEGTRLSALRQIADRDDDAIFEFRRDGASASVEYTRPGQRVADRDPSVGEFGAVKRSGRIIQQATVYGGAVPVRGESVTASAGSFVDLAESKLIEGSEFVFDATSGTRYERNADYEMDYSAGRLKATDRGNIGDGDALEVDYSWRPQNTVTADGVSNPAAENQLTRTITGLVSDRACGFAAKTLVEELSTPGYEATVTLPTDDTGWSVVDAIDPPAVPTGGEALHVHDVTNAPQQTVLTMGNRATIPDLVGAIQSQVTDVERRV